MLKGKFIKLDSKSYGFENVSQSMGKPEQIRMVWLLHNVSHANGNLRYASVEEAIGKEAVLDRGRVSSYVGQGAYIHGYLVGGDNAKAMLCEVTAVPQPKVRTGVEVRWHHNGYVGFWQKYLKTKGWVPA